MRYLESLVLAFLAVFLPIKAVLLTTLGLVFFDAATGVMAAYKRKEKITSGGLKRTIGKIFLYEMALCLAFLCEQYLTGDLAPVCKLITTAIGLVELKSILENLDSINGTSLFKLAVDKITQKELEK